MKRRLYMKNKFPTFDIDEQAERFGERCYLL